MKKLLLITFSMFVLFSHFSYADEDVSNFNPCINLPTPAIESMIVTFTENAEYCMITPETWNSPQTVSENFTVPAGSVGLSCGPAIYNSADIWNGLCSTRPSYGTVAFSIKNNPYSTSAGWSMGKNTSGSDNSIEYYDNNSQFIICKNLALCPSTSGWITFPSQPSSNPYNLYFIYSPLN